MTQTDLAGFLRKDFGLPFHQATIQRIESGQRPIRLNEAELISMALRTDFDDMILDAADPESVRVLMDICIRRLRAYGDRIIENLSEIEDGIHEAYEELLRTWEQYQDLHDQTVDPEMSADMGRITARFERMARGLTDLYELANLGDVAEVEDN
jgi:hypothetical protein